MSEDSILLKLKREWSKDEAVAMCVQLVDAWKKRSRSKDVEIGGLKSYVAELEDMLQMSKEDKIQRRLQRKEWRKEAYVRGLLNTIESLHHKLNVVRQARNDAIGKLAQR